MPSSDHLPYFCIEKSGLVVCLSAMESVSQSPAGQVQAPLINCANNIRELDTKKISRRLGLVHKSWVECK